MGHHRGSTLPHLGPAKSIKEYMQVFFDIQFSPFYVRGEPKDYKSFLLPSVWRPSYEGYNTDPVEGDEWLSQGELNSLNECQYRLKNGKIQDDYFTQFFPNYRDEIKLRTIDLLHWSALSQHHNGNQCHPTRLLDLTTDPFVALYFAVKSHPDQNGFVYYIEDRGNFNTITPNSKIVKGCSFYDIQQLQQGNDKNLYTYDDRTVSVMKFHYKNRRMEAQRGSFAWTTGIGTDCINLSPLIIEIDSDYKDKILNDLNLLNYNEKALFDQSK